MNWLKRKWLKINLWRKSRKMRAFRYRITMDDLCLMTARTEVMFCDVDDYRAWLDRNNFTDPLIAITIEMYDHMADRLKNEVRNDFNKLIDRMITSAKIDLLFESRKDDLNGSRNET